MDDAGLQDLYTKAKENPEAREKLIKIFTSQITQAASGIAGRSLNWENDDELSVSLIAFDEAIDTFDSNKGKNFWSYAKLVIKHRLFDYYRQENTWQKRIVLTQEGDGSNLEVMEKETKTAWQAIREEEEAKGRAEMVASFEKELLLFNISLKDLTRSSPKHKDARENLMEVALVLTNKKELLSQLLTSKQLPIKELMLLTGRSRKVLERGRRYIIALVIILSQEEFGPMKELLQLPKEVGA